MYFVVRFQFEHRDTQGGIAMKKQLLLLVTLLTLTACNSVSLPSLDEQTTTLPPPKIDRRPSPAGFHRGSLPSMPHYDPTSDNTWQVDLRGYNVSKLDLTDSLEDLLYADFDAGTVWPPNDRMPLDFDWERIMELGKNPGLGIRELHSRGITGRNVGIAIIDQALLVDHQEYVDRLRLYEETDDVVGGWAIPQIHGAAVASIAVGKTVGVAPEADLYFIASASGSKNQFLYLARSIRRILEVNQQLPANRKIRVISVSIGWTPENVGYKEITDAVEAAKNEGIFVISSSVEDTYGLKFHGLGRFPFNDPDKFDSYAPGMFWAKSFYAGNQFSDRLLVPMDARTTASPTGTSDYVFYREGGWSWSIPYIAGVYALAAQVDPQITPQLFWSQAIKTGRTIDLKHNGESIAFGPILDPIALIASLQKTK